MSKQTKGLVIGKFYPFHLGHSYLIATAKQQVDQLYVLVAYHESQIISGERRAEWIALTHPDVYVMVVPDVIDSDDSKGWAQYTTEVLGFVPDFVFTSEDYGDPYAQFMGTKHILVDKERVAVPCSGTMIRENPLAHWEFIPKVVRQHYAKRVTVVGVESTGKSTLVEALAKELKTAWVPEYGRTYAIGKQYLDTYTDGWESIEFVHIAIAHHELTKWMVLQANRYLISDTDALMTAVWHKRYMGYDIPDLEHLIYAQVPDLYIVTAPDFPFVQDGTRDGEHVRLEMHQWLLDELEERGFAYVVVHGSHEQRMQQALEAIRALPPQRL